MLNFKHYTTCTILKSHTVFKNLIRFLEDSWNREYFGSLAKLLGRFVESWFVEVTLQETRSIHDSTNLPTIECIAYIKILL